MKDKPDGQIYEEVSRKANPELHAEVDAWLDNFWELVKDE